MFYAFMGWWSAREANRAMPAPDTRTRPAAEAIAAAAITLGIEYPSTKDEIRRARHSLLPRALGETFASGELKADRMADIMDAADILEAATEFAQNTPLDQKSVV